MSYIIFNGELKPESEVTISPMNRGMMYGDGCFETFRSYKGKFLAFQEHVVRLQKALDYLGMEASFDENQFKKHIAELLNKKALEEKEALMRIQCWRDGERRYATESKSMHWIIQADEIHTKDAPLKLILSLQKSIPNASLNRTFKLSNGLNFILAAKDAKRKAADDALMLNIDDFISETTISNIFWIHGSTVFTPSEECDMLPGITRNLIIKLLNQHSIPVEQGKFTIQHLTSAEAVFCTNSIREIQEVRSLDEVNFELGHTLLKKVKGLFEDHKARFLHS